MDQQKPGMFMPALVGGSLAGILSAVPLVNCFCCLWIIGGALVAVYLFAKNSPSSLTGGDGAILGVFTGIVAAVVDSLVSIPFQAANLEFSRKIMERLAEFVEEMPSGWESWMERGMTGMSFSWFMLGLVISAVVFSALGALGGIIGVSLFGKKKTQDFQGIKDETPQDPGHRQP